MTGFIHRDVICILEKIGPELSHQEKVPNASRSLDTKSVEVLKSLTTSEASRLILLVLS